MCHTFCCWLHLRPNQQNEVQLVQNACMHLFLSPPSVSLPNVTLNKIFRLSTFVWFMSNLKSQICFYQKNNDCWSKSLLHKITMPTCFEHQINLPLHRLEVVQKWTETTTAFKHHGAKAPVVHSDSVWLVLKQLRRLPERGAACQRVTLKTIFIFIFCQFKMNIKGFQHITRSLRWHKATVGESEDKEVIPCWLTRYWSVPTKEVHRLPWSRSLA